MPLPYPRLMRFNNNLFLLLLLPWFCFPQQGDKLPLKTILEQISNSNNIKFTYLDEELAVYTLVPPEQRLSLESKLDYIRKRTRLRIEKVTTGYYAVYNDQKMDKPLCGYLIDAETGSGIENAIIRVSGQRDVMTDDKGYFVLSVLTPNSITAIHLGFAEKTISPHELYVTDCPKIKLTPLVTALEEVTAQRYLTTGISRIPSGELVVKPSKFGILPGLIEADVLQTMQQVPGIASLDETVSNVNVRGGTHDQNLFLWNNVRMFQTAHFFGLISAFNPLPGTRITISKNGTSAFLGESVSATAAISSDINSNKRNVVAVDMIAGSILSNIKLSEKSTLQVSGRRTFSDIFASPTFTSYQERIFQNTTITDLSQNQEVKVNSDEAFYFYDFSLQYQLKADEQNELSIDLIGIDNNLNVLQENPSLSKTSTLAQQNFGAGLQWKHRWNDKQLSTINAFSSWYELQSGSAAIGTNQFASQRNTVFDKNFAVQHQYAFAKGRSVSVGYQFDAVSIVNADAINDPSFSRYQKEVSLSHALIAEGIYEPEDRKTYIRAGLRGNYFQKFQSLLIEPRLTVSHAVTPSVNIEVMGELKNQTLSQLIDQQQDFLGIEKRRWTLADGEDVPVQKSKQLSVGMTYSHDGWLLSLDNFYKKVNGITSDSQGFQNQFEFENATGNYSVIGTELLVQKNFGHFYSWVSYSFNDNQYHFDEFTPPGFSNNFATTHAVSWAAIYESNQLRLAFGAKWHTGRPVTTPNEFLIDNNNPANSEIVYNSPNNTVLDDYLQVNFSASKTWSIGKHCTLKLSGAAINLLDRENVIGRFYRINRTKNAVESISTFALGFTPNLSMKMSF